LFRSEHEGGGNREPRYDRSPAVANQTNLPGLPENTVSQPRGRRGRRRRVREQYRDLAERLDLTAARCALRQMRLEALALVGSQGPERVRRGELGQIGRAHV